MYITFKFRGIKRGYSEKLTPTPFHATQPPNIPPGRRITIASFFLPSFFLFVLPEQPLQAQQFLLRNFPASALSFLVKFNLIYLFQSIGALFILL